MYIVSRWQQAALAEASPLLAAPSGAGGTPAPTPFLPNSCDGLSLPLLLLMLLRLSLPLPRQAPGTALCKQYLGLHQHRALLPSHGGSFRAPRQMMGGKSYNSIVHAITFKTWQVVL